MRIRPGHYRIAAAVESTRNRAWDYEDDYTDLETSVPAELNTSLILNIVTECNDDGSDIFAGCDSDSSWQRINLTVSNAEGGTILRVCTFRAAR